MYVIREEKRIERPLIVSYSYSGNTHQIARGLQKATGGDWCVLHPRQPYPMVFSELLEQVRGEIQSGYCPGLLSDVRSPRAYSMIFAGSPNWCGTIAPPLASWLKQYDLNGKIILPFYSHCGGVPCDFQGEIQKICPKAEVREPLGVSGDGEEGLMETIDRWLQDVIPGKVRSSA